ncbi:UNVERIFIED_CONTAM: hypothetical protein Sangu_1597100 [Sesamum angustifolium]|uniref:Exostosin GT47 domain-containing protein n=1 Tax=Sesamum angustifolium TaxID=2727405 RepID=A0AAW2MSF8_9LAMI
MLILVYYQTPRFLEFGKTRILKKPILISSSTGEGVIWNKNTIKCGSDRPILKVFMYDLAPEFHFGLLGWKGDGKSVWPDIRAKVPEYPGGLNLQHSIEYWLTLDLLNSEFSENLRGRSAKRVHNSSEADVVFVPYFASLSYNRGSKLKSGEKKSTNAILQEKLVKWRWNKMERYNCSPSK